MLRSPRGLAPWRDTGIELLGPAVADVEQAFSQTWSGAGPPLPDDELPQREIMEAAGDVTLRVIASVPNSAGIYRLDHLIAALARRSLWLTDAYFVGTTTYVQGLRAAAMDGVDCLWVGHFDLSVSLGIPGQFDRPEFRHAVELTLAACRRRGNSAGRLAATPAQCADLWREGFDSLALNHDVGILQAALSEGVATLRASCAP